MRITETTEVIEAVDASLMGSGFKNVNLTGGTISDANVAGLSIADSNLDRMRVNGVLVSEMIALWKEHH